MKPVKEGPAWERLLTRYFAAVGIPLKWVYQQRRFIGVAGHEFARLNPKAGKDEAVWTLMPQYVRKYEKLADGKQVVLFVTNKQYGDSVDDSLVVLRMGAFIPMLKALVDSDNERWSNESPND